MSLMLLPIAIGEEVTVKDLRQLSNQPYSRLAMGLWDVIGIRGVAATIANIHPDPNYTVTATTPLSNLRRAVTR